MRKLAIAMALASTALATPAVARDQSWYVGIEGGAMIVEDTEFDLNYEYDGQEYDIDRAFDVDYSTGFDVDLIGGYDFGSFRAEAEVGYKRASVDEIFVDDELIIGGGAIETDGRARVLSAMVNGLVDFGGDDGWNGFIGGGVGLARLKYKFDVDDGDFGDFDLESDSESDSGFAWQIIAGVRKAVSYNLDLGLKYRMFTMPNIEFGDSGAGLEGRFRSHSLLASLIYNFGAPPVIVPPVVVIPPLPPATQTCPDGSVILATDICPPAPEPYVPPPPPPVEPERG